ncbi:MAG: GTPase, partial [Mesorhizobium sp.]
MSGPDVRFAIETIFGDVPPARRSAYGILSFEGSEIDRGLCLYFPGPGSVTGEDCGEFHVHGSVAVVNSLLACLGKIERMRPAEAGEFTQRAFLNGKMDLTGVEALSDLIAAETEEQRKLAFANIGGRQREIYEGWRNRLLSLRARLEAELDFSDQEDVGESALDHVCRQAEELALEIEKHSFLFQNSEIIRSGYSVVIVGAPNAGKSSLLNALARRDVAIVTGEAGTTRDLITVHLDIGGYKVNLTDTAGLREHAGHVEAIGIARARETAAKADLVIELV